MPELLLHFAIPYAIATPITGPRNALIIGLAALIPDLDALLYIHRSITHSIIPILIITITAIILTQKYGGPKPLIYGIILGVMSHPILDLFQSYTPILYPLMKNSYKITTEGIITIGTAIKPELNLDITTMPTPFTSFTQLDAPIFTSQGLIISLILIIIPLTIQQINKGKQSTALNKVEKTISIDPKGNHILQLIPIDEQEKVHKEDITIVIPTLNEEKAIGKVIDELLELGYSSNQILVVDGKSQDDTVAEALKRGVKVVLQEGKGKADAILTAIKIVDTDYMLVMDGDYTYDPSYIEKMMNKAGKYNQIIGARLIGRENIPRLHRFGNWIITKLFNLIFGGNLRDICSGMYLVKTEAAKEIIGRSHGFSIEAEIAAAASTTGEITDIPINYRKRIGDKKISSIKDGVKIAWSIITLSWTYNPLFILFALGSLALIPGLGLMAYVGWELIFRGVKHYVLGIISLIVTSLGIISFLFAILTLYLKRMETRLNRSYQELLRYMNRKK
jgi:dolichol-phosphate mannosyltransferase